jgi:hypothetical protein
MDIAETFLTITISNSSSAPLWYGSSGARGTYERLEPGDEAQLLGFGTPPDMPLSQSQPGPRRIEAVDANQALVFCHVFSSEELRRAQWHVALTPGQLDCGPLTTAHPLVATSGPPLANPNDSPPIEGPFLGQPADIAVQASDLGPDWTQTQEWQDSPDQTTTGTLWRRFHRDGAADMLAAATVFHTPMVALAAWGRLPGGSLNLCQASLQRQFDDGRHAGACLMQNALTQLSGASLDVLTRAMAATERRLVSALPPSAVPTWVRR